MTDYQLQLLCVLALIASLAVAAMYSTRGTSLPNDDTSKTSKRKVKVQCDCSATTPCLNGHHIDGNPYRCAIWKDAP